ncbi:MAG: ABC transporter ATP-binding protein [Chloroflexi bacterium]|nr:ABC transporter ATP-binding protein [Chloroflexota bacterium]
MATVPLRVVDATKRFQVGGHDQTVFEQVSLEIERERIFALLGPSGCGKSTLLRAIASLEPLSEGRVELGAEDGAHPSVGIAFQQPLLLPWLTVQENVRLGLRYAANRGAGDHESVARILAAFGIAPLADSYPDELSGGEAQRVALARTVVTQPQVVLLDEPFGPLDPLTRASLQDWLVGIQQSLRLTVVIVTHDVDEAVYLGDRVALMSAGPGRIRHVWETARGPSRTRSSAESSALREEILRAYMGVNAGAAAARAAGGLALAAQGAPRFARSALDPAPTQEGTR